MLAVPSQSSKYTKWPKDDNINFKTLHNPAIGWEQSTGAEGSLQRAKKTFNAEIPRDILAIIINCKIA